MDLLISTREITKDENSSYYPLITEGFNGEALSRALNARNINLSFKGTNFESSKDYYTNLNGGSFNGQVLKDTDLALTFDVDVPEGIEASRIYQEVNTYFLSKQEFIIEPFFDITSKSVREYRTKDEVAYAIDPVTGVPDGGERHDLPLDYPEKFGNTVKSDGKTYEVYVQSIDDVKITPNIGEGFVRLGFGYTLRTANDVGAVNKNVVSSRLVQMYETDEGITSLGRSKYTVKGEISVPHAAYKPVPRNTDLPWHGYNTSLLKLYSDLLSDYEGDSTVIQTDLYNNETVNLTPADVHYYDGTAPAKIINKQDITFWNSKIAKWFSTESYLDGSTKLFVNLVPYHFDSLSGTWIAEYSERYNPLSAKLNTYSTTNNDLDSAKEMINSTIRTKLNLNTVGATVYVLSLYYKMPALQGGSWRCLAIPYNIPIYFRTNYIS